MSLEALAIKAAITLGVFGIKKFMEWGGDGPGARPPPRPRGLEFNQNDIGDPIPLVYGTARVNSPFLAWHSTEVVDLDPPNGAWAFGGNFLLVAGVPPWDKFNDPDTPASEAAPFTTWRSIWPVKWKRAWWGDIENAGAGGDLEHGDAVDSAFDLRDGGDPILPRREFWDGRVNQLITAYPAAATNEVDTAMAAVSVDRSLVPGYRHQMLCFFGCPVSARNGIGLSPNVPTISVEVQALGCEPILQTIGSFDHADANPAWVIWDLLCAPVAKIGYDQNRLDLTSFRAAATTLLNEDHGISLVVYRDDDAARIVRGILQQIDAVLFEDPTTGKIKLKLIRQDFDVGLIPQLTASNTIGRPEVTVHGWRDCVNGKRVKYTSRERYYQPDWAPAHRLATRGGYLPRLRVDDTEFTGITNAVLAKKVAERELTYASRPFTTANVRLNRKFYELLPGDPVVAYWPAYSIFNKVFRVANVDYGQLADGTISAQLIEDVFFAAQTADGELEL